MEKVRICEQLRKIISEMRRIELSPIDLYVGKSASPIYQYHTLMNEEGSIGKQETHDKLFESRPSCGPWPSVKAFHDSYAALVLPDPTELYDPFRPQLSD